MKITQGVWCPECNKDDTVQFGLTDSSVSFRCRHCGSDNSGIFDLGFTIGNRLAKRSIYELRVDRDPSLAIVFAAMAIDCELSWLHQKWEGIDGQLASQEIPQAVLEERLRRFPNIAAKIEGVAKLMYPSGLEDFVANHAELRTRIDTGFPSIRRGSLARDFQQHLFWPRNRILHAGYSGYTEEDANRCITFALLGLSILHSMDLARRDTL